ncbi:MAG: transcriptional regulator GcvA [Alphaproteobacteria bacterium]|jgi:LysR family transcriptional regulator, glycine cleavage system transcriptional activator|nr:transcriptional regulator GcvA [Alphaproteobacteria bacterium]MBT4086249.1 transcriptional regulator GcvA [Alphaproteobacteria bacterium]MBT4543866.1 transcriptional regulator GcvA [Alphaproteobacteria bacterium]MBT7744877.1 transcriptional regulator GcvA [Alphaproteobacteria bacterium]
MKNLPPMNSLRVFEAAGRLLSFNKAAQELNLTPSAVSHAVKLLEEHLGLALFDRPGRGIELSAEGKIFLPSVREALVQLSNAAASLKRQSDNQPLMISAAPALTIGWLMPRLASFQLAHPEIEVRMNSSTGVFDLRHSDIDVAIRSGSGQWDGLDSHFLMSEELVVVCKPGLETETGEVISAARDLLKVPLLHVIPTMGQWRSWLNASGIDHPDPEKGLKFESSAYAAAAAIAGLGVAVVPEAYVEQHIRSGRLTSPFGSDVAESYDFYIAYQTEHANIPRIVAFRDWILKQVD